MADGLIRIVDWYLESLHSGISQAAMHRLFDEYRLQHEEDEDETTYDAILETMDSIAGWGPPERRLFETELPL